MKRNIACDSSEIVLASVPGICTYCVLQDGQTQRAISILCAALILTSLPVGVLAESPLWRSSAPHDITCLSLPADGSYILTGGERICLFADDGNPLWQKGTARLVACSSDGDLIAGAEGLSLFLLNREGDLVWRLEMPSVSAHLALSGDGKQIIIGDRFGKIYFYNADGSLNATADTNHRNARSEIRDIATSDNSECTAVISSRGLFCYKSDGQKVWAHEEITDRGTGVAISEAGDEIVAASDAGIRLLNAKGEEIWSKKIYPPVTTVTMSGDGTRVFAGSQDNVVRCFDRAGEEIWTFEATGWIRDIAVSRDASRILAGSMDRHAYLLDGTGNLLETYQLEESWANHVALTTDGTAGAVASIREVIGVPTTENSASIETMIIAETLTSDEVQAPPVEIQMPSLPTPPVELTSSPEGDVSLNPLFPDFLSCRDLIGVGYLYRERLCSSFMRGI